MFLERLEINGFKSFAHKTSLEFKAGITAIVGPNGSGKSNVADAVRWVLGEQSLKMLRGKKSEDVIFSGSDKKARLGMAEVSLYFNNDKDHNNLGMSEIVITRKLYRNGDSEYLVNKQKSRLLDIQMILAKTGMAHSSYSIIGQGMIDAFLLASPQERKEFFEEASGVKPLQIKRNQSLNKLEHTQENLETASIQLQEITPRLNSLTRQIKKLERRAEIEIKLKEKQHKYYSSLWHAIDKNYQEKNKSLKKIAGQQSEIQIQVEKSHNKMAKLTKDSAKSDEFEKLNTTYQKILEHKMKLSQELANLKIKAAQVVSVKKQNDIPYSIGLKIIEVIEVIKVKLQSTLNNSSLSEIKNLINRIDLLLKPFTADKETKNEDSPKDNRQQIESRALGIESEIKEMDKKIDHIQDEMKRENEKEKQERSQIWELQQKYQTANNELNSISNSASELRVELARLETRKDDLEQEIRQELGNDGLNAYRDRSRPVPTIDNIDKREIITEIGRLKHQLELIGGIDPEVQKEYEEIKIRHKFLFGQIDDLKKSIQSLEKLILDLDETIKKQFEANFKIINQEFQKHFKVLFEGGRSKLTLIKNEDAAISGRDAIYHVSKNTIDEEDVINQDAINRVSTDSESETDRIRDRLKSTHYAGVEIEATPPGKKLKSINMLSGGERALTSIALLCAIISSNPSPFIVLDEVDAALDESNSIRFATIIDELSKKSQFILITHNRATMEKSDILYGVTMGDDGVSTLLSLKLEGAEQFTNR